MTPVVWAAVAAVAGALALAFIGWSDAGAKAAIFEAVANAGLRQDALRLSDSRHALAQQVCQTPAYVTLSASLLHIRAWQLAHSWCSR